MSGGQSDALHASIADDERRDIEIADERFNQDVVFHGPGAVMAIDAYLEKREGALNALRLIGHGSDWVSEPDFEKLVTRKENLVIRLKDLIEELEKGL